MCGRVGEEKERLSASFWKTARGTGGGSQTHTMVYVVFPSDPETSVAFFGRPLDPPCRL